MACQGMALRATKGDENPRGSGAFDEPQQGSPGGRRGPGGPPYYGVALLRGGGHLDGGLRVRRVVAGLVEVLGADDQKGDGGS
jgi:hypothetical protein